MIDYGYYQFNENEIYEMLEQNHIDCNNIIVLAFCEYGFSMLSFFPLYDLYDDCDVYIMERNNHNLNNLKLLSQYENIGYENFSEKTMETFIDDNFNNVYCKMYFGHG